MLPHACSCPGCTYILVEEQKKWALYQASPNRLNYPHTRFLYMYEDQAAVHVHSLRVCKVIHEIEEVRQLCTFSVATRC